MTKMVELKIKVPEDLKEVVEARNDIDWEDIFRNVIGMTLDIYPEKTRASRVACHDYSRRN